MDRREFIACGAGALTVAVTGCVDDGSTGTSDGKSGADPSTATDGATGPSASTETDAETGTETDTETGTEAGSYSVSMEPVGEVSFEEPPETWLANNGSWADMGIALGQDQPEGVWLPGRYYTNYYDEIPGVSVDGSELMRLSDDGVDKEKFYSVEADLHVIDPNFLKNRFNWEESDIAEVRDGIAPFFGNTIFSRDYDWHDYRYYTLLEAFEKLAEVFQERERYEAFAQLHAEFDDAVESALPAESDRPEVAVLWGGDEPEQFYPYVIDEGTSFKHLRDLGVGDALATTDVKDFHSSRGAIDYETLLEVDPDAIMLRSHEDKTREEFESAVVSFMEDHDTASALTAVRNGDVYRGGPLYQGPITNLVVTQRVAEHLYDVDEALYDPQRVSDIVAGEF